MKLFLDTGVFIGIVNPNDANHESAMRVVERIVAGEWSAVHTSDHVIAEALNFVTARIKRRSAADRIIALALGSDESPSLVTSVIRIHSGRFAGAVDRYRKHFDTGLSLIDQTSLVAMTDERIKQLATFDQGFRGHADVIEA